MNFPQHHVNGNNLSAFEKQTASDLIHFRVGPSRYQTSTLACLTFFRLFQFRRGICTNYNTTWKSTMTEEPKHWQRDSPLLRPWYHEPDLEYPKDFSPMTRSIGSFEDCGYEAEMGKLWARTYKRYKYGVYMKISGTSLETSKLVLTSLSDSQWLDTETDAIFFEQTYYNGNTNSFLMFRISWEHVKGGLYQGEFLLVFEYSSRFQANYG